LSSQTKFEQDLAIELNWGLIKGNPDFVSDMQRNQDFEG
jgi:hypothetical protein